MTRELRYEFNVALVGKDERLDEEYFDTKEYTYYVEDEKLKQTICKVVCDNYGFSEFDKVYKLLDDFFMWYELEDEYEDLIDEYLYEECRSDAEKEFWEEYKNRSDY